MRTTIDGSGRVVIPKKLREEIGLPNGGEVEISVYDGRVEIEPAGSLARLVERDGRLVFETDDPIPLTVDDVRDLLERLRR
jgi:AbrB family looped-hinge helix DNA binding protein